MVETLYKLPVEGSSYEAVMDQVIALRGEMTDGQLGKLASTSFQGQNEMQKLVHDAFVEFMDWNGLFSFRESAAADSRKENKPFQSINSTNASCTNFCISFWPWKLVLANLPS